MPAEAHPTHPPSPAPQPRGGRLEHVNVTVSDPDATAQRLCQLFGWDIRWQGASIYGGRTIHVGGPDSYVACYAPPSGQDLAAPGNTYQTRTGLNHIAVVVDDLDATEARVTALGLTPHSHASYEPGRRFYFEDPDGLDIEVVQYGPHPGR